MSNQPGTTRRNGGSTDDLHPQWQAHERNDRSARDEREAFDAQDSFPGGNAAEGRRGSIDARDSFPGGSAAEGRRGSIDARDSFPGGSAAEGRRGSIDARDSFPGGSAAEGRRGSIDEDTERSWQERWPERTSERTGERTPYDDRGPGSFSERERSVRRAMERSGEAGTYGHMSTGYSRSGERGGERGFDRGFDDERPVGGPAYWEHERDLRGGRELREREHFAPRGGHRGKMPMNFTRSDERMREQICEALTESDAIDPTNIDVQVKNGDVTITGSVDDRHQRRAVEDLVENVAGVQDIQMSVKVRGERSRFARTTR